MKKQITFGVGSILLATIILFSLGNAEGFEAVNSFNQDITIYKSSSCGCCGIYASYFQSKGNKNAQIVNREDIDAFKEELGIPSELRSCHTTVLGDYVVEGHVPLEAIEELLQNRPDIKGIALPGMPEGSPGMPGRPQEEFVIYQINNDGSYTEFMKV